MVSSISVIGGGPAGLMAADVISAAGVGVDLYDAMPSVGRKLLMAGRGGLNLTHAEPKAKFLTRYGTRNAVMEPYLQTFGADEVRAWCESLGITTFVGTSQRVFPAEMKAAPLLRSWLRRLRAQGVRFHVRHRWTGWRGDALSFTTPQGVVTAAPGAVVLALGGGSWASLGSDGAWVEILSTKGIDVADLKPSNCGFDVEWSEHFRQRFAGTPVKHVRATAGDMPMRQGEFVITDAGVEGSLVYALSARLRDDIDAHGAAQLVLDLAPRKSEAELAKALALPRGKASLATHLRKRAEIDGVKAGLLREAAGATLADPRRLAAAIKALPVRLTAARPLDEAISSAGGVRFEALGNDLMVHSLPGVFCAGEMLDWEAPTGGYLLTACLATGRAAAHGALAWVVAR